MGSLSKICGDNLEIRMGKAGENAYRERVFNYIWIYQATRKFTRQLKYIVDGL